MIHHIKDIIFAGKAGFDLGRMHIDIHKVGRISSSRMPPGNLPASWYLERHLHTGHHGAVAHIAAIDVKMLHTSAGAAAFGRGDQTGDAVHALLIFSSMRSRLNSRPSTA